MARLTRQEEDFSKWYQEVVYEAGLAEHSEVRGCMVIKPYGYALWENIRDELDRRFKETGHQNAYFPLFIPLSYLSKEAKHVEGFAKECAVVTHHRLKGSGEEVVVDEEARLDEPLVVRPTSETIIWSMYRRWIRSYRDLPLLINQWANVVRWEMRPRLFLRTTEFLWQEGHTAHATKEEALKEAQMILELYADFAERVLAIPVVKGTKTPFERFAGAEETYTIEALMKDGKALQAGTSHFLGQNFAKALDVTFLNQNNEREYVWATSWGVSTRLIGALIMTHGDNQGLVLPPRVAPIQVVFIPIYKNADEKSIVMEKIHLLAQEAKKGNIRVYVDDDEKHRPGWKFAEWELKGVPIRVAMGIREATQNQIEVFRRDLLQKEVIPLPEDFAHFLKNQLEAIQNTIFQMAKEWRDRHTYPVHTYEEFQERIEEGGFLVAYWDGTTETEIRIKEETKATIRCIPIGWENSPESKCIYSGKKTKIKVLFARAY